MIFQYSFSLHYLFSLFIFSLFIFFFRITNDFSIFFFPFIIYLVYSFFFPELPVICKYFFSLHHLLSLSELPMTCQYSFSLHHLFSLLLFLLTSFFFHHTLTNDIFNPSFFPCYKNGEKRNSRNLIVFLIINLQTMCYFHHSFVSRINS